jgi:hypothetical protein
MPGEISTRYEALVNKTPSAAVPGVNIDTLIADIKKDGVTAQELSDAKALVETAHLPTHIQGTRIILTGADSPGGKAVFSAVRGNLESAQRMYTELYAQHHGESLHKLLFSGRNRLAVNDGVDALELEAVKAQLKGILDDNVKEPGSLQVALRRLTELKDSTFLGHGDGGNRLDTLVKLIVDPKADSVTGGRLRAAFQSDPALAAELGPKLSPESQKLLGLPVTQPTAKK